MKILIVGNNLLPGGAERVIIQLLDNFVGNGNDCSLVLVNKLKHYYTVPEKVRLYEIDRLSKFAPINKLKKYRRVRKIVKEEAPDVVLSMPEESGIYVILALLGTKIPVVVSERNNPWVMPNKKVTRALRKLLYPKAAGLIFQTGQAASFFSEKLQKKGIVLPNPLDLSRIPERYVGEREKVIVGAGRLEKQKNFGLLIESFAEFYKTHSDYKLVIYGEGSLRSALEERAKALLPDSAWSLPGRVTDLPERLNKASAFVLSSDYEGMPNVLIEAMAMGVPCVSVDCAPGGAAELIEDGVNGYLVPIGDKEKLTERLICLIDNQNISNGLSKKSVEVKKKLDSNLVCNMWKKYLFAISTSKKRGKDEIN